MIFFNELKKYNLSVETRLIFALAERAQEHGLHFFVSSNVLARDVATSETTVRRVLNDFKAQGLIKINSEIWLNPNVFDGGGIFYPKLYNKQINKK